MSIYFVSDTHLGLDFGAKTPKEREMNLVRWLDMIQGDCEELFLVGDIFDFWFEWRRVVPKGYVRLMGKLAQMCDQGIKIHFLIGNHDQWQIDYFQTELGIEIHNKPMIIERQGKKVFVAHGDKFYQHKWLGRVLEKLFTDQTVKKIAQKLIHPNSMMRFGHSWSRSSRKKHGSIAHVFAGKDDFLVKFALSYADKTTDKIDYFIFGHEHTPVEYQLSQDSTMIILGEWVDRPVYGRMRGGKIELVEFNLP